MEKQGLRFFLLRALAHQFQHWADSISQQIGEELRPVLHEHLNAENVAMAKGNDASPGDPLPVAETGGTHSDDLPSHWRARASADAPPAHWRVRVQMHAPELLKQQKYARIEVPGSVSQAASSERTVEAMQTPEDSSTQVETEQQDEGQDVLLEDGVRVPAPSSPLTAKQVGKGEQPVEIVRNTRMGGSKQDEEDVVLQHDETVTLAVSGNQAEPDHPKRVEIGGGPVYALSPNNEAIGVGNMATARDRHYYDYGARSHSSGDPLRSPYVRVTGRSLTHTVTPEPQPGETSGQTQAAMHWPTLPEEVTIDNQDWEMAWRSRERQQRLDEEQRGRAWNA